MTTNRDLRSTSLYINRKMRVKGVLFFSLIISLFFFFYNLRLGSIFFCAAGFLCVIPLFLFSEKENFLMISFLMPNLFMFKQLDSKTALLGYFLVLLSMKTFLKNYRKGQKIDLSFAAHVVFALLTCTLYSDRELGVSLIRFCFNFSLFAYCAYFFRKRKEIDCAIKMYFAGAIVAIGMGMVYLSLHDQLYNGMFAGINAGRNYFGAAISPAIAMALLYFAEKKPSFSETLLYCATIVFCLISIVLSGSRTSLLSMAIPAALLFYYMFRSLSRRKLTVKMLLLWVLVVLLVFFVYENFKEPLFNLLARFEKEDMKTGNNRFTLWEYYFGQIFQTPWTLLLGNASNSQIELVEHNTILQCLYELGFIGLITMYAILKHPFQKLLKGIKKVGLAGVFAALAVALPFLGINGLYSDQLSFLIILCMLIMRISSEEVEESIEEAELSQ